jgi:hypothetical protein
MKKILACVFSLILLLTVGTSLSAKGATTRITISGSNLAAPIEITDAAILRSFQVWAGPGVFHGRGGVTTEETEGFIIDWPSGVIAERPTGLQHYQVSFYVTDNRFAEARPEELAYVVFYDCDPASERDNVYLPGKSDEWYETNVRNMSHGREGHWFRATAAWQSVARPLIARAANR